MSYEKYTWETGEVITADKLNHMENGIKDAYSNVFDAEFRSADDKLLITAAAGAIKVGDMFTIESTDEGEVTVSVTTLGYCMETDEGGGNYGAYFIYVDGDSGTLKVVGVLYDDTAGGYLQYTVG